MVLESDPSSCLYRKRWTVAAISLAGVADQGDISPEAQQTGSALCARKRMFFLPFFPALV